MRFELRHMVGEEWDINHTFALVISNKPGLGEKKNDYPVKS